MNETNKIEDPHVGFWGIVDQETQTSEICGEMYSCGGKWIFGPKTYSEKEKTTDELYNEKHI